jgi:hypothetical protein
MRRYCILTTSNRRQHDEHGKLARDIVKPRDQWQPGRQVAAMMLAGDSGRSRFLLQYFSKAEGASGE